MRTMIISGPYTFSRHAAASKFSSISSAGICIMGINLQIYPGQGLLVAMVWCFSTEVAFVLVGTSTADDCIEDVQDCLVDGLKDKGVLDTYGTLC